MSPECIGIFFLSGTIAVLLIRLLVLEERIRWRNQQLDKITSLAKEESAASQGAMAAQKRLIKSLEHVVERQREELNP